MFIKYVRDFKNKPIGVVVILDNNSIGYSIVNPKDRWNRKLGIMIAEGRAKKNKEFSFSQLTSVPNDKLSLLTQTILVAKEEFAIYTKAKQK